MCSAPCAALVGGGAWPGHTSFHLARGAGYAVAGAMVASSASALASWSAVTPALRPLWSLTNAAALLLGLYLLFVGRQPAWLTRLGRTPLPHDPSGGVPLTFRPRARVAVIGALWVGWPCGLLQSALMVSALTDSAAEGALAMAACALGAAPGLSAGPWLWRRWNLSSSSARQPAWAARSAGALISLASVWALTRQLAPGFAAYCRTLW